MMPSESRGTVRAIAAWLRRLHGLQLTAVLLLLAAAPLWGALIAQIWTEVPERCLYLINPAAIVVPIVAAIFWVGGYNSRRAARLNRTLVENNGVAIDTLYNVTRHASGRQTGPLRRVQ